MNLKKIIRGGLGKMRLNKKWRMINMFDDLHRLWCGWTNLDEEWHGSNWRNKRFGRVY